MEIRRNFSRIGLILQIDQYINTNTTMSEYLLGINQKELERLQFQHKVWAEVTNDFWDRINIQKGWKCLDAGAGPGFASKNLLERVGEEGEVTLVEPSAMYLKYFDGQMKEKASANSNRTPNNYHLLNGTVETVDLPENHYDFIFVRWVIAFVDEPEIFLQRLLKALKPKGIIAIQDYYYEGLSLYPRGGAFEGVADAVRQYYYSVGGNPYVTGEIPAWFRKHDIDLIDYTPTARSGDNNSDLILWAETFLIPHLQIMADRGIVSQVECDAMIADWWMHRKNPDARFFAPILVSVGGRKP